MGFDPVIFTRVLTILNGQTTSGILDTGGASLVSIQTPSVLTGTAFTFEASLDGTNFFSLVDTSGSAISISVAADRMILLPSFIAIRFLKIVSGLTELGDRSLLLGLRPL